MYNLRIEVGKKVYYNVELGNAYLKAELTKCDPDLALGSTFTDLCSDIFQFGDFVPSTVLFKDGKVDLDYYLDFNSIFENMDLPKNVRCWIMNNTGDTIETFTVYNIAEDEDYPDDDDFKAITLEDQKSQKSYFVSGFNQFLKLF